MQRYILSHCCATFYRPSRERTDAGLAGHEQESSARAVEGTEHHGFEFPKLPFATDQNDA